MLTSVEETYCIGLINRYFEKGYKYYVLHTVTENDSVYDVCLYFSKNPINFITNISFDLENGVKILVDSSSRSENSYNPSLDSRTLTKEINELTYVSLDRAEFIYTNCDVGYSETILCLNSDLLLSHPNSYFDVKFTTIAVFLDVFLALYVFIKSILRIRG